jgi:hypothetical protein
MASAMRWTRTSFILSLTLIICGYPTASGAPATADDALTVGAGSEPTVRFPLDGNGTFTADPGFVSSAPQAPAPTAAPVVDAAGHVLDLPARPADAPTGSEFLRMTAGLSPGEREDAIYAEVMRGNVPEFLRHLVPVQLTNAPGRDPAPARPATTPLEATIWVMPDYLSIGSDQDFVRIPMNALTATRIALELGLLLPTAKVVDAVHRQAAIRVQPHPLRPTGAMTTNEYYQHHEDVVAADIGTYPRGAIVSGHKKDVVVAIHKRNRPGSLSLYGWLRPDGEPMQKISDAHDADYADYAQAVRLVSRTIRFPDGAEQPVITALRTRDTAALLTDEGPTDRYGRFPTDTQLVASHQLNQ